MSEIQLLKKDLLRLIGEADYDKVFERLENVLFADDVSNLSDLIAIKSNYSFTIQQNMAGLLAMDDQRRQLSQTSAALLQFINRLERKDILGKILILSPTTEAEQSLKPAFQKFYPNSVYEIANTEIQSGDFDLVVINDFYWKPDESERNNLKSVCQLYLDKGHLIVYFTPIHLDIVNNNRDKIHAAQSPFALIARVKEMIEYIRYFPPAP